MNTFVNKPWMNHFANWRLETTKWICKNRTSRSMKLKTWNWCNY